MQACSIQIYGLLQKYLMSIKKDPVIVLKLDVAKMCELFEKNVCGEALVSITACGILSDCLSGDNLTSVNYV